LPKKEISVKFMLGIQNSFSKVTESLNLGINKWNSTPRKILFILREAYGEKNGDDFDLRKLIRDEWKGPKYKMWRIISYIAYAIQHSSCHSIPQRPEDTTAYSMAKDALFSSAVINVKKSDGNSSSKPEEIAWYAKTDGIFIKRQIELINPHIIICGNVWQALKHLWPESTNIYGLIWMINKTYVVDYYHPANHWPHDLNYYPIACMLQNTGAFGKCEYGN